ncbi:MAG: hypothetical protein C4520_12290 [Candidatus Abyssobacteria bacterium SURF_5]|uniref:Uncharacterized protein n=1 Tax=Abyssobacteria bacterium (strain SURF_5) TaxID=2093360 RepID=A0A3A4NG01_ABYX5|nr:MAG: hypothetical protein C4520_12290 [Candidatus Abyssubacteria bacterium SURF_5]
MFKLIKKTLIAGIGAIEYSREQMTELRKQLRESLDECVKRGERLAEHEDSLLAAFFSAVRPKQKVPTSDEVDVIIPGYDDMTVTEIIDQIKRLSMRQLEIIRTYEYHNFNRIRIIRQIDKELDEARIIPDYDELPVSEIVEHLESLSQQELAAIRDYEKSHRSRVTILRAIDRRLAKAA